MESYGKVFQGLDNGKVVDLIVKNIGIYLYFIQIILVVLGNDNLIKELWGDRIIGKYLLYCWQNREVFRVR